MSVFSLYTLLTGEQLNIKLIEPDLLYYKNLYRSFHINCLLKLSIPFCDNTELDYYREKSLNTITKKILNQCISFLQCYPNFYDVFITTMSTSIMSSSTIIELKDITIIENSITASFLKKAPEYKNKIIQNRLSVLDYDHPDALVNYVYTNIVKSIDYTYKNDRKPPWLNKGD